MPLARVVTARGSAAVLLVLLLSASAPAACLATVTTVRSRNITAILAARRGLAEFTRALTATGLADAVNNNGCRGDAVTVLAIDDARMAAALKAARSSLQHRKALRRALSRHVLAGYYDDGLLRRLLTQTGGAGAGSVADAIHAPTLLHDKTVKILALQGPDAGCVAFAPVDDDDARAAAVFYVGPVAHDNNVSVLLVSGVMWPPAAAPPDPRLQLEPSTAPSPGRPEQAGPSRASASRLVSEDAVTPLTRFQAPSDVASAPTQQDASDGAHATVIPVRQATPRSVSALQEEGAVSPPVAVAASPPEPGPDDSAAAAPAPTPTERDTYDASILTIFGVLLVCFLAVCCCSQ